MFKKSVSHLVLALGLALPAAPVVAEPAVGFGFSFIFGGEAAVGLRVFSDDKPEEFAASLGVDYVFGSNRVRPTVGAAYLNDDYYLGLDVGYDFGQGVADFSVGAGYVDTDSGGAAPAPTPAATALIN